MPVVDKDLRPADTRSSFEYQRPGQANAIQMGTNLTQRL
jgi:hypothetical protein